MNNRLRGTKHIYVYMYMYMYMHMFMYMYMYRNQNPFPLRHANVNATPTPRHGSRTVFLIEANRRNWTLVFGIRPFVFRGALFEPRVLQQVPCETAMHPVFAFRGEK